MTGRIDLSALLLCLSLVGCGDDGPARIDAGGGSEDGGLDASTTEDAGADDAGDTTEDAGTGCTRVSLDGPWELERDTDVSIGFEGRLSPVVDGTTGRLLVLFERYVPEAPVGAFDLGEGPNANYGTCQQCVAAPGLPGAETEFFVDRGTLTTTVDPYTKRLAASFTNVRLVEVTVDPFTRESTPVEDGRCIELADAEVDEKFAPEGWTCDVDSYGDGAACHCECGAWDLDCGTCDLFDDECEELPAADCGSGEICGFDPIAFTTACVETCDWAGGGACDAGVCVFDFGVEGESVCFTDAERIDDATLGEECEPSYLQKVCNVVDGFAQGFCDESSICRPLCESDDDCTVAGESCRLFVLGRPLGFCGPPPATED